METNLFYISHLHFLTSPSCEKGTMQHWEGASIYSSSLFSCYNKDNVVGPMNERTMQHKEGNLLSEEFTI